MENNYTDVEGIVEVTSYEALMLWKEWHKEKGYSWKQSLGGYLETVGKLDNRPVCISPFVHTINDKKIMFLEATSEVVDWKMIEKWLWDNCPKARRGTYLNKENAMNFHCLVN